MLRQKTVIYALIVGAFVIPEGVSADPVGTSQGNTTVETHSMTLQQAQQPIQIPDTMKIQAAVINGEALFSVPKEPITDENGNIVLSKPPPALETIGNGILGGIGNILNGIGDAMKSINDTLKK